MCCNGEDATICLCHAGAQREKDMSLSVSLTLPHFTLCCVFWQTDCSHQGRRARCWGGWQCLGLHAAGSASHTSQQHNSHWWKRLNQSSSPQPVSDVTMPDMSTAACIQGGGGGGTSHLPSLQTQDISRHTVSACIRDEIQYKSSAEDRTAYFSIHNKALLLFFCCFSLLAFHLTKVPVEYLWGQVEASREHLMLPSKQYI